ncbi:MAG: hypothetical protein SFW66_07250 [Gammaproteobacteria bacterium]|nr:hypothetical protein [Gammaproteobacteria bacterium]
MKKHIIHHKDGTTTTTVYDRDDHIVSCKTEKQEDKGPIVQIKSGNTMLFFDPSSSAVAMREGETVSVTYEQPLDVDERTKRIEEAFSKFKF